MVEIKANWGRARKQYGRHATDIVVATKQNPGVDVSFICFDLFVYSQLLINLNWCKGYTYILTKIGMSKQIMYTFFIYDDYCVINDYFNDCSCDLSQEMKCSAALWHFF